MAYESDRIAIKAGALTTNFLYFYDTKVRVTGLGDSNNSDHALFYRRNLEESDLLHDHFSSRIPEKFIKLHIHGYDAIREFGNIKTILERPIPGKYPNGLGFDLAADDPDRGYSFFEADLYHNGVLGVLIRLQNITAIEDGRYYVDIIKRPDKSEPSNPDTTESGSFGPLVKVANEILRELEPEIASYITGFNVKGIALDQPLPHSLQICDFQSEDEDFRDVKPRETVSFASPKPGALRHRMHASRPHVGTVINFRGEEPENGDRAPAHPAQDPFSEIREALLPESSVSGQAPGVKNHSVSINGQQFDFTPDTHEETIKIDGRFIQLNALRRFAIACSRTDAAFFDSVVDTRQYFEAERPPKNIYHPGPSIFLISRRSWACFNIQSLDDRLNETLGFLVENASDGDEQRKVITDPIESLEKRDIYNLFASLSENQKQEIRSKISNLNSTARKSDKKKEHIENRIKEILLERINSLIGDNFVETTEYRKFEELKKRLDGIYEDQFRDFRTGVAETVLIVLESMHASIRANRRFLGEVSEKGAEHVTKINKLLGDRKYGFLGWARLIRYRNLQKQTSDFVVFLASLRSNSPVDEISLLLPSHLLTHTAIHALERIEGLSSYQDVLKHTSEAIESYESFLGMLDQHWNMISLYIAVAALAAAILAVLLSIDPPPNVPAG